MARCLKCDQKMSDLGRQPAVYCRCEKCKGQSCQGCCEGEPEDRDLADLPNDQGQPL